MRVSFEQVALEDAKLFSSPGSIEDALYGYLVMLHSLGWTHIEYSNELFKRIDKDWQDVQDRTQQ
jgi:hypothetical protein